MTPVGHTLTGLTIALLALPVGVSSRRRLVTAACFAVAANLPDLPFPGWGHDRYDISHSVFVISLILIIALLLAWSIGRFARWAGGKRILFAGALACLSHLLLDTFYNHGNGLPMFWPVSEASLALPIPWFSTLQASLPEITGQSLRVFLIELVCYGPIFLAAWLWMNRKRKRLCENGY